MRLKATRTLTFVTITVVFAPAFLASCATRERSSDVRVEQVPWRTVGRSVQGRPIEFLTIGSGDSRVLIVGGIHGNEIEPAACIDPLCASIRDMRANATIHIVRDLNPDGSIARSRGNARGVDLNRNWPATNFRPSADHGASALSEPESQLLHSQILSFRPEIIVVFHSIPDGPFVNFDGPAAELANCFSEAAARADPRWHVRPSIGYPTRGSLGTWAGIDRGIPILTIEFDRGHEPALAVASLTEGVRAVLFALSAKTNCDTP